MFVTSTERPATKTACTPTIVNSTPARKNKVKPPLEMKNSSGRKSTFNIKMQDVELGNSVYPAPSGESMNKLSEESSLKWKYSIRKESTITETMISAIAAKYTNEKKKPLNKGLDLLNRSKCDESQFLDKMQRKKLKEEKGTHKEHKGGSTIKSLNRKIEDSTTDVYRFVGSSDEPTITLGMKYEPVLQQYCANKRETEKKKMKNGLTEKVEPKALRCRKKKYFFTDTDTDGKTDVSWLRESNRKIKPKLVAYTRQKKQNLTESSGKGKVATLQRQHYEKRSKSTKQIEATNSGKVQDGRKKRTCPRRSTAARPCYKEVSASEFDSSEESLSFSPQSERNLTTPPPVKNIFNNIKREANMSRKPCEVSAVSSIHSFTNTSSIEKMRYERPCEPMASTRTTSPLESESSIQSKSLPEPLQTSCLSMETISCKTKKDFQDTATPLLSPIHSAAKSAFISDFSPIVSSVSMPEVTPICLQSCEVNENDEEVQQEFVTLKKNNDYTTMKKSCSSESSVITARSSSNFTIKTISSKRTTAEETLSTSALLEEGRREMDKVIESEVHKSGPSNHASVFKRIYGEDHQSNFHVFEEDGGAKDEGTGLRPRKLFKCDLENQSINRDAEFQIRITSDHASVDNWELNTPNMETICQQFRKELQKKFQKHSQRIDTFTKFSLKSAQKRMSSTSLQIHSYRLQRLNKFQTIFTQELERFEKDSQSLKMMEKELTNFWKNHSQAFSELKENEEQRIQHLKSSFENNLCPSVDFEEQIFSNEMHLMRKDMKTVQERLLKEMQEEELVTVRRGLQSFFQSETMRF
ncbi:synaptonemal complex protein 2-like [Chiloscyllium punctatum]|uniref:synaptonemal complex protein 2-like n=1 Tax=Chiloscyllium punctatum TaxID=137246 RepID=UPI003B6405F7